MFLPFNGGQRPLLMFDGIANAAKPRAFILRRAGALAIKVERIRTKVIGIINIVKKM